MRHDIYNRHGQKIGEANYLLDDDGNPAGGWTRMRGIEIHWQAGPLVLPDGTRAEPTGAFIEDLIIAGLDRMGFYQTASEGRFACEENEHIITKLREGLHWQYDRTDGRLQRGVEGTHKP